MSARGTDGALDTAGAATAIAAATDTGAVDTLQAIVADMLAGHAVTPAELVVLQVAERLRQQLVADSVAEPAAALAEAVMPVAALVAATVVAAAMAAADTGNS